MGGKNSKPAFSRFDDLVGDHSDVFAKLKEVLVALGLKQPSAAKKQKQRQKAAPELATCSSSSVSSDPVTIVVHCDDAQTPPAAAAAASAHTFAGEAEAAEAEAAAAVDADTWRAAQSTPQWCSDDSRAAHAVLLTPVSPTVAPSAAELTSAVTPERAAAAAAAAQREAPAAKPCVPLVPLLQLSAVVPPLNPIMRISVSSAASTARGEAESIFACVDQEQQRRDKEEALHALAAAAAAAAERYTDSSSSSSSGGCRQRLTEDEKQALRDSGKAAREADSQQLAARVEQNDAALRRLSQQGREQWFQDNAQQQQTDAPEEGFEEEWAALPPEVLEMVAQLQARG